MEEAEVRGAREEQEMVDESAAARSSATEVTFRPEKYQSPLNRCLLARDSWCAAYFRSLCQTAAAS